MVSCAWVRFRYVSEMPVLRTCRLTRYYREADLSLPMTQANIKHHLLRPLDRRKTLIANQLAIVRALERLDERTFGNDALSIAAKSAKSLRKDGGKGFYKNPAYIQNQVALSKALYLSRRISRSEYVCFASEPVSTLNEERWLDGQFKNELHKIEEQIHAIDKESGLLPDRYWPNTHAPEEFQNRYNALETQYSAVIESHFRAALREFGLDDLANLRESNSEEFDRLRERGRRSIFHKSEHVHVLKDIVVRHEEEAFRAASAKVYTAGIILIGAALEGLLLIRCLRSKQTAIRTAGKLPKRQRPSHLADPSKWKFDALINICLSAGWLPCISTEYAQYAPATLADILREMRNRVHPGRCMRESPWSETDERDYKDAEAIYVTLRSKLLGRRSLTDTAP